MAFCICVGSVTQSVGYSCLPHPLATVDGPARFRCLADGLNLQDSVAKLLVDYVDALLRKGGLPEPPEEREIEGRLDDLITLCVSSPCLPMQPS